MMRTLEDPTFIVQVCYGVIALPLYIATFVAILRTKARKGTFFRFYMACGVVNIISYLDKYLIIRLPLYTCGQCALSPYFMNTTYWWLPISMFIHWHTIILQPMLSTAISLDRFIVLIMRISVSEFWKRCHLYFIAILFLVPIIFTYGLIGADAYYGYLPGNDNFRVYTTAQQHDRLFDCLIGTMIVTTVIGACFNFSVFFYFIMGKIKVQGAQRTIEIKLFCNSVTEITTQICATAATLYQRIFLSTDSTDYDNSRVAVLFPIDAMTLLPPFVIILTCTDVRHYLIPSLKRKNVSVSHATLTAQPEKHVHN